MTAEEYLAEWQASGVGVHAIVDRAMDDDRWAWGNDPEGDAVEIEALCTLLARNPARLNETNQRGQRLVHVIVEELARVDEDGRAEGERLLMRLLDACFSLGADPNVTDECSMTPLFYALDPRWIERLVAAGGNPDALTADGATVLMHAVQYPACVEALLTAGADPERHDRQGRTARDWATHYGAEITVAMLDAATGRVKR